MASSSIWALEASNFSCLRARSRNRTNFGGLLHKRGSACVLPWHSGESWPAQLRRKSSIDWLPSPDRPRDVFLDWHRVWFGHASKFAPDLVSQALQMHGRSAARPSVAQCTKRLDDSNRQMIQANCRCLKANLNICELARACCQLVGRWTLARPDGRATVWHEPTVAFVRFIRSLAEQPPVKQPPDDGDHLARGTNGPKEIDRGCAAATTTTDGLLLVVFDSASCWPLVPKSNSCRLLHELALTH